MNELIKNIVKENVRLNGQLLSISFTSSGIVLLIFSAFISKYQVLSLIFSSFGSTLFASGAISIGIEFRLNRQRSVENEILVDQFSEKVISLLNRPLHDVERVVLDMTQDIDWKFHITNTSEIVVCWWSGRGWTKVYLPIIRSAAKRRTINMTIIMPNIDEPSVLSEMIKQSNISEDSLRGAQNETIEKLRSVENLELSIQYILRTPPYMYMRLGEIVAFKLYPYESVNHQQMPMFVVGRNSELGRLIESDVEKIS